MKTNGNDPAFPKTANQDFGDEVQYGLTIREYFAAMAMQGTLANPNAIIDEVECGQSAVIHADALIEALNKDS